MAEDSRKLTAEAANKAAPVPRPTMSDGNPVFRMMGMGLLICAFYTFSFLIGLPRIRAKLPSRNWLIFLSVTGSFTSILLYDRYQKRRIERKWCNVVSHIAKEPLLVKQMPRKITIFISAPPGDGLRAAREYFQDYVKPVLVAAALDWDVVEGRREGEVRAGLAEKIRKSRRRNGETSKATPPEPDAEELTLQARQAIGVQAWSGSQGDLIIGRHTWKEYVRGLHEGWLGPLDPPPEQLPSTRKPDILDEAPVSDTEERLKDDEASPATEVPQPAPDPPRKPSPPTPFISPSQYLTSSIAPSAPAVFPPSLPLSLPHILGFTNTPIRIYRFLTRRYHADKVGHEVASLVLAAQTRSYDYHASFASSIDPDSPIAGAGARTSTSDSELGDVLESGKLWEQQRLLAEEEPEWHKSARKPNPEGEEGKERVWLEDMVVDERIGGRMRTFGMSAEDEEKARRYLDNNTEGEGDPEGISKKGQSWIGSLRMWAGWGNDGKPRGWEQGLVGEETE